MGWTIRFDGYLPVDDRLEERLRRVVAEFPRLPDAAVSLDEDARVISIDCSRIPGWQEAARGLIRTTRVGKRIVVKPAWEAYAGDPDDIILDIDAGGVFGTGLHETTALCLELLESHVAPGSFCVDFGTGSGILAVAAARLGAARVVALDALPAAVSVTRANARLNGLQERITVAEAGSPACAGRGADLVTANVTSGTLCTHADALFRTLRRDGVLIASGIVRREAPGVTDALSAAGFQVARQVINGQWVALVGTAAGQT